MYTMSFQLTFYGNSGKLRSLAPTYVCRCERLGSTDWSSRLARRLNKTVHERLGLVPDFGEVVLQVCLEVKGEDEGGGEEKQPHEAPGTCRV